MKINILVNLDRDNSGGSANFLGELKNYLIKNHLWSDNSLNADLILLDSFRSPITGILLKLFRPHCKFVLRVDGPISVYRNSDVVIDKLIYALSFAVADGIIFQSFYSLQKNIELGMKLPTSYCVIHNAARDVFNNNFIVARKLRAERIKLVASSWSTNFNKGFEIYKYLDENLDFSKYEMLFVGNTIETFINIKVINPTEAEKLALLYQEADILVMASKHESCSNTILEALASGLTVVAIDSGSNSELIGSAGLLFVDSRDIIDKIESVAFNVAYYQSKIKTRKFESVYDEYTTYFSALVSDETVKKFSWKSFARVLYIILYMFINKIYTKLANIM